jgi:hypothetical protein
VLLTKIVTEAELHARGCGRLDLGHRRAGQEGVRALGKSALRGNLGAEGRKLWLDGHAGRARA